MLGVVMLCTIMVSVVMLSVIMPNVVILTIIMLSVILVIITTHKVVTPSVFMLRTVMLSAIALCVIIPNAGVVKQCVIFLNVVAPRRKTRIIYFQLPTLIKQILRHLRWGGLGIS